MANPELAYLRQLMGETGVHTYVFGVDSQHLLGRWQKRNPNNLSVPYTEELVSGIPFSSRSSCFPPFAKYAKHGAPKV